MKIKSIEEAIVSDYLDRSTDEIEFEKWATAGEQNNFSALIIVQGFEERSYGFLEKLSQLNIKIPLCIIARYPIEEGKGEKDDPNYRYSDIFEKYANQISSSVKFVDIDKDGEWVICKISQSGPENGEMLLDITGLANSLLFSVLDNIDDCDQKFTIAYTEAKVYWPKEEDCEAIKKELDGNDPSLLADRIDTLEWLYNNENVVKPITGHEGYDTAGYKRALVGFLTFKCVRLASILLKDNFSCYHFIIGIPRLPENEWRRKFLKEINYPIIKSWPTSETNTFGYRSTVSELIELLLGDKDSLLNTFNVSLAPLGSKLQTIGCWVISRICKSIAIISSSPTKYYPDAFSEGIGQTWIFPFEKTLLESNLD